MTIRVECPGCGHGMICPESKAGKLVPCPECKEDVLVPLDGAPSGVRREPASANQASITAPQRERGAKRSMSLERPELPAGVEQDRVGRPISEYKPKSTVRTVVLGFVALVAGCGLFVLFPFAEPPHQGHLGALAAVLVGAGCVFIYRGFASSGLRAIVCEDGFIDCSRAGTRVWRWDEIEAVYEVVFEMDGGGMSRYYRVKTFDGEVAEYTHLYFKGVVRLGEDLQREVARAHLPDAMGRIDAGQEVKFGGLHVSKEGLRHEKLLLWEEFDSLKVKNAVVKIYSHSRKEAWASVMAAKIPNLGLLERVIKYARTGVA